MRGYYEIGVYHSKRAANIGTLWRSAYQLGASGIFTIEQRFPPQASDTTQAWRHIPLRCYQTWETFHEVLPYDASFVAIEMEGKLLPEFVHPERAIYLLGAEDHGLPPEILARCHQHVALPAIRMASYNVAVAGTLVLYDRMIKQGEAW